MTLLKGVQYWALFNRKTSYLQILRIIIFQNALSNLVANSAGVASYFTLFRVEQDVNFKRSGLVFLITKIGDLFSMGSFLLIATLLTWKRVTALHQMTSILLAGILLGLFVFIAVIVFRGKLILLVAHAVHWLQLDRFKFVNSGLNLLRFLAEQEQKKLISAFLLACLLSLIYMSATVLYAFSRVKAFHIPIDFWASTYMVSFMQFISLIPIQILGGLGVSEFVSIYFFNLFGITQFDIPATLIGRRVMTYLFSLISLLYIPLDMLFARLRLSKPK